MTNQGFTLIELLVVVLIVGILAAVALPQYEQAVEKSRMTEAMVNMKAIADAMDRYWQAYPGGTIESRANIADVDLKGGSWSEDNLTFTTDLFVYTIEDNNKVKAVRKDGNTELYKLELTNSGDTWIRTCTTDDSDYSALCTFFSNL